MGRRDRTRPAAPTAGQVRAEAARVRTTGEWLGRALWVVAALALVFTMANVTTFAVQHHTPVWIAWLLDPMASLTLLVVLVGDSVLSRHGMRVGAWSTLVKWGAGAATWAMNIWQAAITGDHAGVVLHSVAPALVIGLAEVTPVYRQRFADLADALDAQAAAAEVEAAQQAAAQRAAAEAARAAAGAGPAPQDRATGPVDGPGAGPVDGPDRSDARSGPVVRLVADRSTEASVDRSAAVARRTSGPVARSPRVGRAERATAVEVDRTTALLPAARRIAAAHQQATGRPISRRALAESLRGTGETCSTATAATLLELLAAPGDQAIPDSGQTGDRAELVGAGEHVG